MPPMTSPSRSSPFEAPAESSTSRARSSSRRPWTQQEDEALIAAVTASGVSGSGPPWTAISKQVGGERSNKDCRKRWFHTLGPNLRKGRWTNEEDAAVRAGYAQFGTKWREIAARIPGRTDEQVAKRWKDVLSPGLTPEAPWTPEEDAMLLVIFSTIGPKWTLMSDSFPGRNGIACRNRFRRVHRPNLKSSSLASIAYDTSNNGDLNFWDSFGIEPPSADSDLNPFDSIPMGEKSTSFQPYPNPPSVLPQIHTEPYDMQMGDHSNNISTAPHPSTDFNFDAINNHAINLPDNSSLQNNSASIDTGQHVVHDWLANPAFDETFWTIPPDQSPGLIPDASETVSVDSSKRTDSEPIKNVWGLLVALESGSETLTLTATLVRQLLADASKK